MKSGEALILLVLVVLLSTFLSFTVKNFGYHTKSRPVTTYRPSQSSLIPAQGQTSVSGPVGTTNTGYTIQPDNIPQSGGGVVVGNR